MVRLLPSAEVGFLGMQRDEETLAITTYANRLPEDLTGRQVYVLDPMLATGGSMGTRSSSSSIGARPTSPRSASWRHPKALPPCRPGSPTSTRR